MPARVYSFCTWLLDTETEALKRFFTEKGLTPDGYHGVIARRCNPHVIGGTYFASTASICAELLEEGAMEAVVVINRAQPEDLIPIIAAIGRTKRAVKVVKIEEGRVTEYALDPSKG